MIKEPYMRKRGSYGANTAENPPRTFKDTSPVLHAIRKSRGNKPTLDTLNTASLILTQLIQIHNALDVILTNMGSLIDTQSDLSNFMGSKKSKT